MKKLIAILLALCLTASLCGCELPGKKLLPGKPQETEEPEETAKPLPTPEETEAQDPNVGTYVLWACEVDGVFIDAADVFGDVRYAVELRKSGRANLYEDEDKTSVKYEIDGGDITIFDDEETIYGTIGDGLIRIEAPEEDGVATTMVFAKEDRDNSDIVPISLDEYLKSLTGSGSGGSISSPNGDSGETIVGVSSRARVEIVGVEKFNDYNGNPSFRLYFDYTNRTDETLSAYDNMNIEVYQDNRALEGTYIIEDLPYEYNMYSALRPNVTIRCFCGYNYNPDGGAIRLIMEDWWEDETILDVDLNPAALPAAPGVWNGPEPIFDPSWTDDMEWEGDVEDLFVYIDDAESLEDYNGEDCIRVYYEITNNGSEPLSASMLTYRAFQDGIELDESYYYDEMDTDEAFYSDIEIGCTAMVSRVYILHSSSGVEVEVFSYWEDEIHVGGVFY